MRISEIIEKVPLGAFIKFSDGATATARPVYKETRSMDAQQWRRATCRKTPEPFGR